MKQKTVIFGAIIAISLGAYVMAAIARRRSAALMSTAANSFLAGLNLEQRAKATFPFEDEQRFDWHFTPRPRKGIPLKELDAKQRQLAHAFLKTGLSQRGYLKASSIIALETVLRAIDGRADRDPENYFFTLFGTPSTKDTWGWRVEGHHLSLNFTIVNGRMVATTPTFFGSNPAEVKAGPQKGLRILAGEEDSARDLLLSLDEKQRAIAIFDPQAPPEMLTFNKKTADRLQPVGILTKDLKPDQRTKLLALLNVYAGSMAAELAAERMEKVRSAGIDNIRFGWAGSIERGQGHYYRVQGPTFLIEYDNTQTNANHIHSVWRDFDGDFGRDLLMEHYKTSSHHSKR